jgi:hypothetical protein
MCKSWGGRTASSLLFGGSAGVLTLMLVQGFMPHSEGERDGAGKEVSDPEAQRRFTGWCQ